MKPLHSGSDHNLLANRHQGDPHRQYHHKAAPLTATIGPTTLACPVIINEAGALFTTLVRVESDTNPNLATLYGTGAGEINLLGGAGTASTLSIGTAGSMPAQTAVRYEHNGLIQIGVGSWAAYVDPINDRILVGYSTPIPAPTATEQPVRFGTRAAFEGGFAFNRRTVGVTGSINTTDTYVGVSVPFNGSADITLTLPAANNIRSGAIIIVKDETGTANPSGKIIIAGNGLDEIDGQPTVEIQNQFQSMHLISNGIDGWFQFV